MANALSPTILALSLLCANGARAEACYGLEFPETGNLQIGQVVGRRPAPLHREAPPG